MTTTNQGVSANATYGRVVSIRQKIMDFFYYAVVDGQDVNQSYGTCQQTCGKGVFKQKCCAEVSQKRTINYEKGPFKSKDFWYVCINQSVAAANLDMNIADYSVSVKCVESGARRLVSIATTALLAYIAF